MLTRSLGPLDVSVVGLGCNNFGRRLDYDASAAVVHAALDEGITLFDTADVYGGSGLSEEYLGRALGPRRDDIVLATKFGAPMGEGKRGASPDYVRQAVEDSLSRLGTDRIDLYQLHMPDPGTPIDDTLGALNELVEAGKVRYIGCSNFSVDQLQDASKSAAAKGTAGFVSVQNEYSILERTPEAGVLDECVAEGAGFLPYFPLASGLLTGKYRKGQPQPEGARLTGQDSNKFMAPANLDTVEALAQFVDARNHTMTELAFSWLLTRPAVSSVIAGATKIDQIKDNVRAASWSLSDEDLAALDALIPAKG
jgi:aryl-alcohol dehydrogenase-like predicted oxidoreductase